MKGCQILAEKNTNHMKACTLWATEPERLKSRKKCGHYRKFYCFRVSLRDKKGVQFCSRFINPIQTGEGGGVGEAIVPALILDVYNFFNKQAKPTKLGHFS